MAPGTSCSSAPVGRYELTVSCDRFRTVRSEFALSVRPACRRADHGRISGIEERVDVATAGALRRRGPTRDDRHRARDRVACGQRPRHYLDLALLAPGVSRTNTGSGAAVRRDVAVPGTGISVSSQRNLNNAFVVDGLSANDDAAACPGRSTRRRSCASSGS
jgi:hypothetical protein